MYKKFDFEELCKINSNFFKNIKHIYTARRYAFFKEFLKKTFQEGDSVYFFESNDIAFRIFKEGDKVVLVDEKDKIEMVCDQEEINKIHNLLKNDKKVVKIKKDNSTILQWLMKEYANWDYALINWKPFLVYDIETVWNINDLRTMRFMMWYSIISNEDHVKTFKYRYVSEKNLGKFVDFMVNFDWYIVGYNNIYFDNPVSIYNSWLTDEYIDILNKKSIDLFLFIWNLTGRRIWLDKISSALVSLGKTLESWAEGEQYLKDYLKTWDETKLAKVKSYCKNDVKMTLAVILYFMKHKNLYMDWEDYKFELDDLVTLGARQRWKDAKKEEKKDDRKTIFCD